MKALVSRPVLYFSLAIVLLGGSGWTIYSKFFVPTDKTPVAATSDQEDSEGTKNVDEEQDVTVSPPDSDAFSRLAPSSDGSDGDFQLASEPTLTVDTADSDSFVIDNTLPAPLDNGNNATSFSIGDDPPEFSIGDNALVPPESTFETDVDPNDFELANIPPVIPTLDDTTGVNSDVAVDLSQPAIGFESTAPAAIDSQLQPLTTLPALDPTGDFGSADLSTNAMAAAIENRPGTIEMEGEQLPSLSIRKIAPAEVQVNHAAVFTTRIKNVGKITAYGVKITDYVPRGTRLESAHPEFIRTPTGAIQWELIALEPGEEASVSMKVTPLTEGEIGSVATVSFATRASVRTVSTKPQLTIQQTFNKTALIGETVLVNIVVSNPGSGDATGIVVEADIPTELSHVAGNELEYQIGTLRPGQSKQLQLRLLAKTAGIIQNILTVRGKGQIENRSIEPMRIVAPALQVSLRGPAIRYLDRQTTYSVEVLNPGTASARNVELVAYLPKGLKFVSTDHHGEYDNSEHAVYWKLEELPPQIGDSVKLMAIAIEPGEQKVRLEGTADLGVRARFEHVVRVESVPELEFSVKDTADPIELGSDTMYEIKVVNRGTRTATGVQIAASFPQALKPIQGGGPSDVRIEGQIVLFSPLQRLAPGAEAVFRVKAKAIAQGDNVIRVQISSDDKTTPVTKEESTRVYLDN
ncbi:MAG: DUF11 domain-containing protein [Pirellulaceae bacterium]|nr:DUF11 domain-containing protein [Pirellulaceae bacterium]